MKIRQIKLQWKNWLLGGMIILAFVLISQIPVILFDFKHGGQNGAAIRAFFTERETTINLKIYLRMKEYWPLVIQVVTRLLAVEGISMWLTGIIVAGGIGLAAVTKKLSFEARVLILWGIIGVLGMTSYKQNVFDHYFGFLYPVPFLLVGWSVWILVQHSWNGKCDTCMKIRWGWLALSIIYILGMMVYKSPLRESPNGQWKRTDMFAVKIIEKAEGKPFNLALLANTYDEGYRFAMEKRKSKLVEIDPQRPETITEQLFVICEIACQPIGNPQSEIARFGWVQITDKWDNWGSGIVVYRLRHLQPEENNGKLD